MTFLILSSQKQVVADSYWDLHQDSFSYLRSEITTEYDPFWETTDVETNNETLVFFDFEPYRNTLTFRVTDNQTIFNFIHCQSQGCIESALNRFQYDNETNSIQLVFKIDNNNNLFGFEGGNYPDELLGINCTYPLNVFELNTAMLGWRGILGCFLPLELDDYIINTDPDINEEIYQNFSVIEKSDFVYNNTKLEGFSYDMHYSYQAVYGLLEKNITDDVSFKYLPNGVLCSYESKSKIYDIFNEEVILITDYLFRMYLEEGFDTFKVVYSLEIVAFSVLLLAVLVYRKKRKRKG